MNRGYRRASTLMAFSCLLLAACNGGAAPEGSAEEEVAADDQAAPDGEEVPAEVTAVTLNLGHPFPASHPIQVGAIEPFIEEVGEVTNGTVTIEIVPGGALGAGPSAYENTVVGAQDLGWALQGYTPGRFPISEVVEMPFTFATASDATDALWKLYEEFPEFQEEYADVHVLGLWTHDSGGLWTSSGNQVSSMEAIAGLTLRAPGPMQNDLISQLGGSPVGMPAPELYDSLERGVIDGLMIAASGLESFNLFEVLDHGVKCNCYVAAQFLVVNSDTWESLSPEQQTAIDEVAGRTLSMRAAEVYDREYEDVNARLGDEGVELTVLEGEELERWEEAGSRVAQEWVAAREADGVRGQAMHDRLLELVD